MALSKLGNNIAGIVTGEMVGIISDALTNRVKIFRQRAMGKTEFDGTADQALDVLCQIIFVMLGVNMVEKAMPSLTQDLSTMLYFFMGLSTQTTLPSKLRSLTNSFMADMEATKISKPTIPDASAPVVEAQKMQ